MVAAGIEVMNVFGGSAFLDVMELARHRALDQARVARRTGGTDRVVRAGDAQVQGDFTGWIVRYRPRVVVVRPDARVVVELRDLIDLVLGLDVAVLGDPQINASPAFFDVRPIEP